jgi:hypothetical protein
MCYPKWAWVTAKEQRSYSREVACATGPVCHALKDERNEADYNETVMPSPEDARDALQAAVAFLDVCGSRYGFRPIAAWRPSTMGEALPA